jgi:hypothetical protein
MAVNRANRGKSGMWLQAEKMIDADQSLLLIACVALVTRHNRVEQPVGNVKPEKSQIQSHIEEHTTPVKACRFPSNQ